MYSSTVHIDSLYHSKAVGFLNLMTSLFQSITKLLWKVSLDSDNVWEELMMEAWIGDRVGQWVVKV